MSGATTRFAVQVFSADRGLIGECLAETRGTMDDRTPFVVSLSAEELHLQIEDRHGAAFVVDLNMLIRAFADSVEEKLGKSKRIGK